MADAGSVQVRFGFIDSRSAAVLTERLRGFRQGLKETGYVEGDTATIAYRWAENQLDRIPALAGELVRRPVAVIVASGGTPVALRVKATGTTIPVVFISAEDPVKLGLVQSLARPGGNFTGINFFSAELVAKRLELLRALVPSPLGSECSSIRSTSRAQRPPCVTWSWRPAPWACSSKYTTPATVARSTLPLPP